MSYTPINWQTGDTITAEKMNKMDNGWGASAATKTTICQETIEATGGGPAFGIFTYANEITSQNVIITLNGVEYECQYDTSIPGYGGISLVDPPFAIVCYGGQNKLVVSTAGTYSVKIEEVSPATLEVSSNFANAVALHAEVGTTTFQEIDDAIAQGRIVVLVYSSEYGSLIEYVCQTDKTATPLEVYAITADSSGCGRRTYLASTANSPITTL